MNNPSEGLEQLRTRFASLQELAQSGENSKGGGKREEAQLRVGSRLPLQGTSRPIANLDAFALHTGFDFQGLPGGDVGKRV